MKLAYRFTRATVVIIAALFLFGSLCACAQTGKKPAKSSQATARKAPVAPDLSTPKNAVRSYLDWVSYAYYIVDSDVATSTMSPSEEVRVNSYVQLNQEEGRRIDQNLDSLEFVSAKSTETSATIVTKESWTYRYLSLDGTSASSSPMGSMGSMGSMIETPSTSALNTFFHAKYDATYSLVKEGKNWVVDSVKAKATTAVK